MIAESSLSKAQACKILEVSRSGFYKKPNVYSKNENELLAAIRNICLEFSRYGYRRVTKQLHRQGVYVNHKKVLALMKVNNLLVKSKKTKPKTTNSNHSLQRYSNLLEDLEVTHKNQVWVTDITYVVCGRIFLYLALIMDLFSRKIVGWELSRNVNTELTLAALNKAVETRGGNVDGCIHHSDHGSQYLAGVYMSRLHKFGMLPSMGEVGNSYDNAFAESLNKTVKNEEVWLNEYETFEEAYGCIAKFVKIYNEKRLHSSIGYVPPNEYEQDTVH